MNANTPFLQFSGPAAAWMEMCAQNAHFTHSLVFLSRFISRPLKWHVHHFSERELATAVVAILRRSPLFVRIYWYKVKCIIPRCVLASASRALTGG